MIWRKGMWRGFYPHVDEMVCIRNNSTTRVSSPYFKIVSNSLHYPNFLWLLCAVSENPLQILARDNSPLTEILALVEHLIHRSSNFGFPGAQHSVPASRSLLTDRFLHLKKVKKKGEDKQDCGGTGKDVFPCFGRLHCFFASLRCCSERKSERAEAAKWSIVSVLCNISYCMYCNCHNVRQLC